MKSFRTMLLACCVVGMTGSVGFADAVSGVDSSYGNTSHSHPTWQFLGDELRNVDSYGVSWSVDGGLTFGRFDLIAGQNVVFKVNMAQPNAGTHYSNLMKMWIDDGADGSFDADDAVAFEEIILREEDEGALSSVFSSMETFTFDYKVADDFSGSLSIRTRVTCSESLLSRNPYIWGEQWEKSSDYFYEAFNPTGWLNQGETEDWTVNVNAVPEPGTMMLFGAGLAGIAGLGRRRKK